MPPPACLPACLQDGMNQSEQKAVLAAFRNSEFNVLVATCIGEEGLDIPEVGGAEPTGEPGCMHCMVMHDCLAPCRSAIITTAIRIAGLAAMQEALSAYAVP